MHCFAGRKEAVGVKVDERLFSGTVALLADYRLLSLFVFLIKSGACSHFP